MPVREALMGATASTDHSFPQVPPGHPKPLMMSLLPPDFSLNMEQFLFYDLPIYQCELRCITYL